jgi:gliding motility-associated-like protein
MKIILAFLSILTISMNSSAQLEWANRVGGTNTVGTNSNIGNSIAVDYQNNLVVAGQHRGNTDFDLGIGATILTSIGGHDMFISKYNATGGLIWAISMGGAQEDVINSVATDNNGNIYITGRFQSASVDMDPGIGTSNITKVTPTNFYDIFVAKYDANGNHIWSFSYGSNFLAEAGNAIDVDNAGNVYVTGYFRGTIDFNPGAGTANLSPSSSVDIFVAKYTTAGIYVWAFTRQGPATGSSSGTSIKADNAGNIYVGGRFEGTVDFDPSAAVANVVGGGNDDGFVAKYSDTGVYQWVVGLTNSERNYVRALEVHPATGDVLVGGTFQLGVNFNPNGISTVLTSPLSTNAFIARYSSLGVLIWARQLTNTTVSASSQINAISLAPNGNLWCTGEFRRPIDFDFPNGQMVTPSTLGTGDIFVGQYNATNGNYICAYPFGEAGYDSGNGIANFSNSHAILTGLFQNTVDFDPSTNTQNLIATSTQYNTPIIKLNPSCPGVITPLNAVIDASSLQICRGQSITFTDNSTGTPSTWQWTFNGGSVTTASTQGPHTVVFNTAGTYSIQLQVGDGVTTDAETINITVRSPTSGIDTQNACGSFTWINGISYTASNNSAVYTIVGGAANGCDSVVTLNLTINSAVTGIDTQIACNSFTWINGSTYTASNSTASFNIVGGSVAGCDSTVTLNLTINTSSTGIDTQAACNTFTWIDGNTYTSNNSIATFNIVGGNSNGCDSTVTLNLTIKNSTSSIDTQTACNAFTWIDGNTYTANNNTATFTIVGGNSNGCDSTVTLNLTILAAPIVTVSANSPICEGEAINLTASSSTSGSYFWTGPNGFTSSIQNPTINAAGEISGGIYQVIVSIGNTCADSAQVTIVVNPSPKLVIVINPDSCSTGTGNISVVATSPNAPISFLWSNGSTEDTLTGLFQGDYQLTVTDNVACSTINFLNMFNNKDGCDCFVYVANAFSPNGDNNNEFIPVRGLCVKSISFKIFNRWGNLVFETDQLNEGWNGYYQDELQNTGVFVYVLEATLENGKTVKESGDITLIR